MLTFRALPLLLLAIGVVSAAAAQEPTRVRVVSYNIHHGEGTDGKLDLKRIAQVLSDAKPDIVALQEVDQNTKRTENVDQTAVLAKLLKMNSVFGGNIDFQGGRYGNAILTKYSSISVTNHPLPALTSGEQRGLMEADISVPGMKQPLKFLATHFDYRGDDKERVASCEMIAQLIRDWGNRPALLAGDLNALPESRTLTLLENDWTRANRHILATFPSDTPTRQIDYIMLRPMEGWKVVEYRVLDSPVASDHRGILAVLDWAEPSTK
ncbi:endonuclease/exonuclease/phosphatase family protein [Bremerella alba]|uniref:Endonuclease/exonuclease/phosphatase domain-containing protein n=1 Tax=Bremerella alba TaxID=980252 RepID=A0A7V8V9J8_9BACT|nr:endonuclease/exonuclease/phosphatase family protein [Bremerella alba]MBA2117146.1 hypothetical protein [Bremerella alba]